MKRYVFPNAEIPTLLQVLRAAASAGFEVRDVESLREHYVLTLRHWVRRLEANHDKVLELADEVRYRVFRVYMAAASLGFSTGLYNLHQCLLVKPFDEGRSGLPLTRADWYA
jgi:cyclopropane-fatty-acyl-phospholipid synthase